MTDRLTPGYEPRFDLDAKRGHQGELLVARVAEGIVDGSVEVKTDDQAQRTGNVYVEWSCLRRGRWEPSSIATTEAEWWAWALADLTVLVAMPTLTVLDLARDAWRVQARRKTMLRGSHPTQGVLLPVDELLRRALTRGGQP